MTNMGCSMGRGTPAMVFQTTRGGLMLMKRPMGSISIPNSRQTRCCATNLRASSLGGGQSSCSSHRSGKPIEYGSLESSGVVEARRECDEGVSKTWGGISAAMMIWMTMELPALAIPEAPSGSGPPASSYYVSLGLFLLTLPGLWSLIKRAPKAKIKRKTFEVLGPAQEGAMPLDARARQIFDYFKSYNYTVKGTGEVITFQGRYQASIGQAAALMLYTFISLASTALVLSIAAPFGGNYWYLMCLVSPAAGLYYLRNANRTEEFKVKMVTADDDSVTDIVVEGDEEEIERMRKELGLLEKGMEYVKGILER